MGRAVVRRHALVLSLLLAAALAACSSEPGLVSDAGDLDVAVSVWSDAWVAASHATVAGPSLGSNGQVDRVVARRETSYDAGVEAAARAELRVAAASGWETTSSTCGDTVEVALVSANEDALAQLVVTPDGEGASVALQVAARHHLDTVWKTPEPVDGTCLDGESPAFEAPPLASDPLREGEPEEREAEWEETDAAQDFVDAVNADPAMAALGVEVTVPKLDDGVNRRQAPGAEVDTTVESLQELAERLTGWRLTYAACGGGGPVRATFVQDIADGHAVVSAEVRPDGTTLRVTLPVTEGPTGEWLDGIQVLDPTACMQSEAPRRLEAYGTPAVLPSVLTPIAD
ncbi:hypothetical protein J2X46_002215 [Nocardioides sp. BE266]|uniref:hypothetical protein n=1 Tax=Nocardioides sp. BE266 TaxID=2817725 RepID=UPI0028647D0D|nr:hypothetical protein [Nocardioides sp. BE266]MDR7253230.1 hypothetical protein [Nocardioides sp. BE266]